MFKTDNDLKDFILWCRTHSIESVKVDNIEVKFSQYAFIDTLTASELGNAGTEERNTSKTLTDTAEPESEDDLLFWSSKA